MVSPQNWTCIARGALLPGGNWSLGLGWGVFVFFSPVICHPVLDLTSRETGAALLDFVRSCICFIAKLIFGTQASLSPFTWMSNCCVHIYVFGVVPNVYFSVY